VAYEFARIGKIALATFVVMLLSVVWVPEGAWLGFGVKCAYVVLFVVLMYGMKFFDHKELVFLQGALRRTKAATGDPV
jgi:hypothetical protein